MCYGLEPDKLCTTLAEATTTCNHIVELSGLEPDKKYYYSVGTEAEVQAGGKDFFFMTAPSQSAPRQAQPIRVWVVGDAGRGNDIAALVRDGYLTFTGTSIPGSLVLDVHGSRLDVRFIDCYGEVKDYFTILKKST